MRGRRLPATGATWGVKVSTGRGGFAGRFVKPVTLAHPGVCLARRLLHSP